MGQVDPSCVDKVVRVEPGYEAVFTNSARVVSCVLYFLVESVLVEVLAVVVNRLRVWVECEPEAVLVEIGPASVDYPLVYLTVLDPRGL